MPYAFLDGQPYWVVYFSLLGIVLARAQMTYWIGRGVGAGLHRSRLAERIGAKLAKAEHLINRFGPPAVTFSFLTVGIQTAVNLAAGAMRMAFPRYLVAMFVGCLIWAGIYSVGVVVVLNALRGLFLHSPSLAVAAVLLLLGGLALVLWWRRSRRGPAESESEPTGDLVGPSA
ncbi:DedA family protein [Nocardiopsis ansamitocini]|uniref:VTT domain-containing protein n=1 Tax=Nocardiopsis ansamitocini TaxID=1670832 RepID=A0A9W6P3L5_9ACTN|nr:VTT domain-containing protein [Nocardiopsis ansamitocini]GLU46664.1 hypothetical protein Nans01_10150 [Nocardiopsis ansamitocini]